MDWNLKVLHQKIDQLGKVIKIIDKGRSPDIIVLQEIENYRVLKMLRDRALPDEGYREIVLIEGKDARGIDVGILSKYPLAASAKIHHIKLDKFKMITRPIVDAVFNIENKKLRILGNHWPSQRNPNEARVVAAKTLYDIAEQSLVPTVALGDFNTGERDRPHGINLWLHDTSARFFFSDAEREAYEDGYPYGPSLKNRGTHYYKGKWTSLDKILVPMKSSKTFCSVGTSSCLEPTWSSFEIVKRDFMLNKRYTPKRFDLKTGEGFSDHLPIVLNLKIK